MIQANELRIGNIVDRVSSSKIDVIDNYYTVFELDEHSVSVDDIDGNLYINESVEGIKLTEEWLLRFGFRQWGKYKHLWKLKNVCGFTICTTISFHLNEYGRWRNNIGEMEYVHQLQNLYFALTGQELELKSEAV